MAELADETEAMRFSVLATGVSDRGATDQAHIDATLVRLEARAESD